MNCLTYALSRWHEHGGALRIVRSRHWGMPHVLHEAQDGTVTHYVPPRALGKPIQSLMGFDGKVRTGDNVARGPMPLPGIGVGAWLLPLVATGVGNWQAVEARMDVELVIQGASSTSGATYTGVQPYSISLGRVIAVRRGGLRARVHRVSG